MAEDDPNAEEVRSRAQKAIYGMLADTIRRDNYPSPTMMNIVESHMSEDQLPDYLEMLMDKIDGDQFPSMDMIRRIVALT